LTDLQSQWDISVSCFPDVGVPGNCFSYLYGKLQEVFLMKNLALFAGIALAALFVSSPILAHHGETNYDTEKLVTVKATVTSFEFINPHTQILLDVKNDKGETEKWTCEARSPAMLVRNGGWDKNTLKPGDTITAIGFRAKNGTNILRLKKIVLADGKELPDL
jgi:hypothetical protein